MIPKIFLLFAMIIISVKVVKAIHKELFLLELCNDGFYDGGIMKRVATSNKTMRTNIRKNTLKTKKSQSVSNYASYGDYKKMRALS
ncbi:MAG: hypothetical protein ACRC76_09550 [Proteocatella sp.]